MLILFYLFSAEELGEVFTRFGYPFDADLLDRFFLLFGAMLFFPLRCGKEKKTEAPLMYLPKLQ